MQCNWDQVWAQTEAQIGIWKLAGSMNMSKEETCPDEF